MNFSTVQLLLIITFFNSLAAGVTTYLVSPHITSHGGNDIITGIMVAGTLACQKISKNVHAYFRHGIKFCIALSLIISFITYLILIFTTSCWIILLCRLIYALFNRVEKSCKEFVIATEKSNVEQITNLIDINHVAGTAIGAILGGYIYYLRPQFTFVAMLATVLTFLNMFILEQIDTNPEMEPFDDFTVLPLKCEQALNNIKQLNWKKDWDVLLLKSAYITSFTIFFAKYALLLKYNYGIGTLITGYTVAYQTMLLFASKTLIPVLKEDHKQYLKKYFEPLLLACSITLVGEFYAPSYECYLLVFIPLIFTHSFLDSFLDENLNLKSTEKAHFTFSTIIEITVPFLFGFICYFSGKNAFKIFSMLPSAVCIYILNQRFTNKKNINVVVNEVQETATAEVQSSDQGSSQGPKIVNNENKQD